MIATRPTVVRPVDPQAYDALIKAGVPAVLARIYAARGVAGPEDLDLSMHRLARPDDLVSSVAIDLVEDAVVNRKRIVIVGDYDCDGATATALLVSYFERIGIQARFFVPNRVEHGYGLSPTVVKIVQDMGCDLLITVDNGVSAIEGVAAAKAAGMTVLITDHHLPPDELPAADAIVNPNMVDCVFPWKSTCGVGVAFYLAAAVNRRLIDSGYLATRQIAPPKMAEFLDLVALGTVADVVPLEFNNRLLVEHGLRRIHLGQVRPGIDALISVSGRKRRELSASDLGFAIGPRVNSVGRIKDMTVGVRCLLATDVVSARTLADELHQTNAKRRGIEGEAKDAAMGSLLSLPDLATRWGIVIYDPDYHEGVIGLVAARIKESLHRPAIVFTDSAENGVIKASARSIKGFHLRDAIANIAAKNPGLIPKFGGHAMAAGLSINLIDLDEFAALFDAEVRASLTEADIAGLIETDGALATGDISIATAETLASGGPWGQHFPEPSFQGDFVVRAARILKERHLKLTLDGNIDAIHFNAPELDCQPGSTVSLVYRLSVNEYNGNRTIQLMVESRL